MQLTEKSHQGLEYSYHVVLTAAEVAAETEAELAQLSKKVKIQGFRPGKVPMNIMKQKYGRDVMGDVLQASIDKAVKQLVSEKKLRPAMQPDIKIESFEEGRDLSFDITLEVMPEVGEVDYSALTIDELTYDLPEEEVQQSLERIAKSRRHPHKKDGAAALGDVVKIDFLGKRDGVPFQGGEGKGFHLELGSNQFIPGFEEQLVGLSASDAKTISVTFPAEYHSADLAGAAATFDVTVHEVAYLHTPEVDDKLAQSLGLQDLANLKTAVSQEIDAQYKQAARAKAKKHLFDLLETKVAFDLPSRMLKAETDAVVKQVLDAKKAGDPELKDKSDEELTTEYGAIAERRVRLGILLSDVARKNNLAITREEISAAVMGQARQYPGQEDKVFEFYRKNPQQVEELKGPILEEKAVDHILGLVKRAQKKVTIEQLLADDAEDAPKTKKGKK